MAMTWKDLEPLLHGPDGARAEVIEGVRRLALATSRGERAAALDALVAAIGREAPVGLLARLAGSEEPFARRLALELAARIPAGPPAAEVPAVHPLLRHRRLPGSLKLAAAAALLRACADDPGLAGQVVRAFLAGHRRSRSRERLTALRRRVRGSAALKDLCDRWLDRLPMACPACDVRLSRPELVKHLWDTHRLTLDGDEAVEPWRAVERGVAEYARAGDPAALDRCCELARRLDPESGLERVHRLLLREKVSDAEAVAHLRRRAADRGEAVCPHCFGRVPVPCPDPVRPVALAPGRVSGGGYEVDLAGGGLITRLVVRTPEGTLYCGAEPGRRFSRSGLQWLLVTPQVLLAFALAVSLPFSGPVVFLVVVSILLVATVTDLRLRLLMRREAPPADRVVDHAWSVLVPHLLADGASPCGCDFLAGLSLASVGRGAAAQREARLAAALESARSAGVAERLGALAWLVAADAPSRGRDPAIVLTGHAAPAFTGEMPLSAAEAVLDPDRLRGWPAADRARLRVLLAGHAFAAGLGVWDLQELGRAVPAIGEALGSEDGDELGRLLLLWSLREQKPWQKCGPAASAFDLARYPALGGEYLRGRPDLLLFQPTAEDLPEEGPPAPILVCGAGIVFREAVLTRPGPVKVTARPLIQGGGFELHVGGQRLAFRSDPTELARRLERWARYLYGEFQPKVDAMLSVRNPALLRRLLEQRSLGCPECGRRLVGRRGEVGWPLRERSAEKAVR